MVPLAWDPTAQSGDLSTDVGGRGRPLSDATGLDLEVLKFG